MDTRSTAAERVANTPARTIGEIASKPDRSTEMENSAIRSVYPHDGGRS